MACCETRAVVDSVPVTRTGALPSTGVSLRMEIFSAHMHGETDRRRQTDRHPRQMDRQAARQRKKEIERERESEREKARVKERMGAESSDRA